MNRVIRAAAVLVLTATAPVGWAAPSARDPGPGWPGEEMPLPLSVRTPADLALKAAAERQYLVFNLLAGGKHAFDRGDFHTAARKWEALLAVPGLDPEVERIVRPFAAEARARAGGSPPPPPPAPAASPPRAAAPPEPRAATARVTVSGTVSGGGALGPGGAVLWLKRADGPTPRPTPGRTRVMNQVDKKFVPRVLPVTVGTKVDFKNQDGIFHNVFSLSRPNDFDAGLYKSGASYARAFDAPGPVQILCNIHATMIGYVVVVDSPWYAQASAAGAFSIRGVPPGEYLLETWHESAASLGRQKITVGPEGLRGVQVQVAGDRRGPTFVPDKAGKLRQVQLGY